MNHVLTVIVTRNVEDRYRGFIRSAMLEVSAGIYISPRLNRDARDRLWEVIEKWYQELRRGSIIMIWRDKNASGNVGIRVLGETPKEFIETDGFILTKLRK